MAEETLAAADAQCPRCGKPSMLCVCAEITPIDNRIAVLILQHPQEQDAALATAQLTRLSFKQATLKIGLSWPSLAKILGRPVEPRRWAVLYLGSARPSQIGRGREVVAVDRKGAALAEQDAALAEIEGVILLDGSWSQAKALWWRNAWLLKCRRVVLAPLKPSRFGKLRREPRRESLATIEAAALLVSRLEARPEIEAALGATFAKLLDRYRTARRQPSSASSNGRSASP